MMMLFSLFIWILACQCHFDEKIRLTRYLSLKISRLRSAGQQIASQARSIDGSKRFLIAPFLPFYEHKISSYLVRLIFSSVSHR